jgi:hypothetical protein
MVGEFMRQKVMATVAGILLCTVSGCVVHDSSTEQAPMWWPAFMVRQSQTSCHWGQSIYGRSHPAESNMQSLPSAPAQPDM